MNIKNFTRGNLRTIKYLDTFFLIIGCLEVVLFGIIKQPIFMIMGMITAIPALISLREEKFKLNFLIGALAILKYNPLSLTFFGLVFSDFLILRLNSSLIGEILFSSWLLISFLNLVCGFIIILKSFQFYKRSIVKSSLNNLSPIKS